MFNQIIRAITVFFFFTMGVYASSVNQDKIIPRELFFSDPQYSQVQISHDGKHLAYLAPSQGVLNVWVGKLGQRKSMHSVTHKKKPRDFYVFLGP